MANKKDDEPILQWQDGLGNIPVFQDEGASVLNTNVG